MRREVANYRHGRCDEVQKESAIEFGWKARPSQCSNVEGAIPELRTGSCDSQVKTRKEPLIN